MFQVTSNKFAKIKIYFVASPVGV